MPINLDTYDNADFDPGGGFLRRAAWLALALTVFENRLFIFYKPKRWLLRMFGAKIGVGVVIKPGVRVKYPWNLEVGDHVWIGEDAWLDNLVRIRIGDHVCISQRAYLCTGSHDFRSEHFDLKARPINIGSHSWVAACCTVLGGVTIGRECLCGAGSLVSKDVPDGTTVGGVPAEPSVKHRLHRHEPMEYARAEAGGEW